MESKKLRVLVVDNEPIVADSLGLILNLFGYEATSAYNSTLAIDMVRANPYDFLIADVVMPGYMSGIDLAIQLPKLLPNCKILLMSGNNLAAELLKAAEKQGYEFDVLPKPVHPDVILQRIKALTA